MTTTDPGGIVLAFVVAAALGAVVGLERQVEREDGEPYAGVRTFALYGTWGAAAGYLGELFGGAAFAVAAGGFIALVLVAYVLAARSTGDWGSTSEAAAFITFVAGVLAWEGSVVAAVAITVGTAALLRAKGALHELSRRFSEDDLRAALQFGVLTAVVLPLVPDEDLGPFQAINPREIWLMVVLVSAIGLVGYVALRLRGDRGLVVTGFVGGLVSSTAVTLGFSQMSRRQVELSSPLAAGILGASGLMYLRVLVEATVVEPRLAVRLAPSLLLVTLGVLVAAAFIGRTGDDRGDGEGLAVRNPLTLSTAVQFGLLYGVIVFVSRFLVDRVSSVSLSVLGAVAGINDVDAITLSAANLVRDGLAPSVGVRMVLAAVLVNTLVKASLAAVLGHRRLGRTVLAVSVPAAVAVAVAWGVG